MAAVVNKSNLRFFYVFLALALLSRVYSDIFIVHRWGIHTGDLFPYRRGVTFIPLYSEWILLFEWALIFSASVLLLLNRLRLGVMLATVGMAMSLTQMFQNQKLLIFIVLCSLCIEQITFENEKNSISKNFLKWQLLLVYFFSAFHKILGPFSSGEVLRSVIENVLHLQIGLSSSIYAMVSWVIVIIELLVPLLLILKPRTGIVFVILLHAGMSAIMPDILAFTLVMIALAFLFLKDSYFFSKSE